MKAEARSQVMSDRPGIPEWLTPPPEGFMADDLDNLPDLPAHTELIDGSLVFVSPQASFHTRVLDLLTVGLRRLLPADLRVRREMGVILNPRQRPEPDISVIRASAERSSDQTSYSAEDVVLVIEVVSPESQVRDRERKPVLYAQAGIPHFWRVENTQGRPAVIVHEHDPATRTYALTGIYHDHLKLTIPFAVDIDLTEIDIL
jgi:Uma2 family endonuclease